MSATEFLKSQALENWQAATTHGFTNALADGSLAREKMAGYLQQDYLFVDGFVRLLASAVAHAPTLADAVPSAQFLGLICDSENTYFLRSLDALGVPQAGEATEQTGALQNLMETARLSGKYQNMLAVLVVAEWSYLEWASPFQDRVAHLPFWLGEWITLHSGPGFSGVVAHLRGQLDAVWDTLDDVEKSEVSEIFIKAVALERAFFDAAWDGFLVAT